MPTEYPADFKQKVIKRYQNGESIKSLSHELHIAQGTLYRWRKAYCTIQGTTRTYTPKEFDAISRRLAKLEHEMEIIRLSQCIANVPLQKRLSILEISTISLIILIVFMSCAKHWMSLAVHFTTTSFAVRTAASATKSRHNSCVWYSRLSTTAANGMVPKRFALHWPKVVSESAPSALLRSCRSSICAAFDLIPKSSLKSIKNTASKTCWSSNLPQNILIKHGSVILHTSSSTITGFICASFSTSFPGKSSAIAYPAMPARIWSPVHFG